MAKKKPLELAATDLKELKRLTRSKALQARKLNRCRILLLASSGKNRLEIAEAVDVAPVTVDAIVRRYQEGGLDNALNERPRSGAPSTFTGRHRAKITALACSVPPEGRARWTVRLLSDKAVELDIVEAISYNTVAKILKKTS